MVTVIYFESQYLSLCIKNHQNVLAFYVFNAMITNGKKMQGDVCLLYRDSLVPRKNAPDKMYTGNKTDTKLHLPSDDIGLKISVENGGKEAPG